MVFLTADRPVLSDKTSLTFLMLSSAYAKIYPAHNVKMPTVVIVGILTFISSKNYQLNALVICIPGSPGAGDSWAKVPGFNL